jgi:hypothetical protein
MVLKQNMEQLNQMATQA